MMSELERKFGKYAVKNLSLALILCYAFGYMIEIVNSSFLQYLSLNPYAIVHGQIWRIFTWLIMPPSSSNLFFTLIMLFFYYSIGTMLERVWGAWKYNVYIFTGILFTVLGAFLFMAFSYITSGQLITTLGPSSYFAFYSTAFSTYYVNMSIFLAYAITFPENVVLVMFILPLKVKYLGIVYALLLAYDAYSSPAVVRIAIICSLMNAFILWITSMKKKGFSFRQMKRKADFRRASDPGQNRKWTRGTDGWMHSDSSRGGNAGAGQRSQSGGAKHRCTVCGRTELTNPELDFRYCSKCEGVHEYCNEHLFTHVHIKYNGQGKNGHESN